MAKQPQSRACKVAGIGLIALDLLIQCDEKSPSVAAGGTCGNVLAILALLGWQSLCRSSNFFPTPALR